jgi:hypothetical protein
MREEAKIVLRYMLKNNVISKVDNVLYSRKVFELIPYVEWCYQQVEDGRIDEDMLGQCLILANKVLEDKLVLFWKSGVPHFRDPLIMKRLVKKEEDNGKS